VEREGDGGRDKQRRDGGHNRTTGSFSVFARLLLDEQP